MSKETNEIIEKLINIDSALFCINDCLDRSASNPADYGSLFGHAITSIRDDISRITETLQTPPQK